MSQLFGRDSNLTAEQKLRRFVYTCGIVGIATALSAIMIAAGAHGWDTGFVVSIVTLVMAAWLWSTRNI